MVNYLQAFTRLKPDEPAGNASKLDRTLRLIDLIAIGVGATLGAGVYILAGDVAVNSAGPAVTLCFAIAAVVSILSGICYAELGCRVPRAGSGYAYLYSTIGELPAFAIGWCLLLSYVIGTSSVASALSTYLNDITGGFIADTFQTIELPNGFREKLDISSLIVVMLLGVLMCVGVESASKVVNVLLSVNILTIVAIVLFSIPNINFQNWKFVTDFGSEEMPNFFTDYYNATKMVINTDGAQDPANLPAEPLDSNYEFTNSFVFDYCLNNAYEARWYKDPSAKNESTWEMTCTLQDRFSIDNNKDIYRDEGKQIKLATNYGGKSFEAVKSDAKNGSTTQLIIQRSQAGTGGYIPYSSSQLVKGVASCFYGFVGFDAIATTGEEAIDPQENIPKAIVISLSVICAVYLFVSGFLTLNFPYFAMNPENPFATAFAWNGLGWINTMIRVGAICALSASLIGAMFPMPRILYNMAEDGLVYEWTSRIHKKTKVPVNATIVATVVAGILAAIFDLNVLIDFMSIGTLAAYVLVAICVLILRYRPDSYDLKQPGNLVTKENGEKAKSLTYWLSGVCMVGFLIHAQVPKLMEEGSQTAFYIEVGSVIPILLFTVYVTSVLRSLPETQRPIAFKVPLLPYFPIMNMIVNIYLMASLDVAIWYKLMCWLGVGFFIYFTYGVKHSKENPKNKYADEEKANLKLNEQ